MKASPEKIERLISEIDSIIEDARRWEETHSAQLDRIHPQYERSGRNLLHYRALRSHDLRDLQRKLGNLGLPRLARAEGHVMATLLNMNSILRCLIEPEPVRFEKSAVSIKRGEKLLRSHTKALLGYRSKGRRVRIMVTLPSEAAENYELVDGLVEFGMNSARINCAHDGPDAWANMIEHVRTASKRLRRRVKICMDLGGPKIRTGAMRPGPQVVSFAPECDNLDRVVSPALLWLAPPHVAPPDEAQAHLPVDTEWLSRLQPRDRIRFEDTRGKARTMSVFKVAPGGCWARSHDRSCVVTGTVVSLEGRNEHRTRIGELPSVEEKILLKTGDRLILHKDPLPGEPAEYDRNGELLNPAHISCTNHEIFDWVQPGERILFDDGKIVGVALKVEQGEQIEIEISYTKSEGQKLRADKGINLPDTSLELTGLTAKDRDDLVFVCQHADVVNMSFVNTARDVQDLIDEIDRLGARGRLGVVLKIETQQGFDNLTDILLTAMQTYPVGIMIARGDLAVECGWENMARMQEEILSLCTAAHVPDIWATQVLENLARKGLPSRSEVTDAAMAQRAECVMLNKGPHILEAIQMLDRILRDMKDYHHKKAPLLPPLVPLSTLDTMAAPA